MLTAQGVDHPGQCVSAASKQLPTVQATLLSEKADFVLRIAADKADDNRFFLSACLSSAIHITLSKDSM